MTTPETVCLGCGKPVAPDALFHTADCWGPGFPNGNPGPRWVPGPHNTSRSLADAQRAQAAMRSEAIR